MTEDELQAAIIGACNDRGLWHYHPHNSRRDTAGWVDLVILGRCRALFVELKSADGRRSRAQMACAARLAGAGLEYRLWRPEDWPDRITAELEAIR